MGGLKLKSDYSSESLKVSASYNNFADGVETLSFLGPFIPMKLFSYSIAAIDTLQSDLFSSFFG